MRQYEPDKVIDVRQIRKEWKNIDLLIIVKESDRKLVITIENKVLSNEHSDQLQRYRKIIEEEFVDYIKLFMALPQNLWVDKCQKYS